MVIARPSLEPCERARGLSPASERHVGIPGGLFQRCCIWWKKRVIEKSG